MKRFFLILAVLSFVMCSLCYYGARAQETVFVPVCSGTNDTSKFANIIATIGSNHGTIRLPYKAGSRCAVSNLTIPSNVTLDNSDGTGIKINTGQTLTDVGPRLNPKGKQIWYNALPGQGTVVFTGSTVTGDVYPQEWGAKADGATDNILPLRATVAAAKTGARSIHFTDGTWSISDTLTIPGFTGFRISCENKATTQIRITTANKTGVFLNHGSYGVFDGCGFTTSAASSNLYAVLDIDADGTLSELKTQQITLRDIQVNANSLAANGLRISRSGAASQGDTIELLNPLILSATEACLRIGSPGGAAQNALGITITDGNLQNCTNKGIFNTGGQIFVNGSSFQGQDQAVLSSDGIVLSQISQGGADYYSDGGAGTSALSSMTDIRSESDVLAIGSGIDIRGAAINASSVDQWFAASYYNLGQLIHGTTGVGNKGANGRAFMLVDQGVANPSFETMDDNSTLSIIRDVSQSWTIDQWAGFYLVLRFPNGFIVTRQIASNTGTALTLASDLPFDYHNPDNLSSVCGFIGQKYACSQYKISNITGGTEPTWDSVPHGVFNANQGVAANGFITTVGSNVVNSAYYGFGLHLPAANDYIVLFGAGTGGGPLIAKITASSHPTGSTAQVILDRNAVTATPDGAGGYVGTPVTDGGVKWIDIDYNCVSGAGTVVRLQSNGGKLGSAVSITDSAFVRPDFLTESVFKTGNVPLKWMKNTGYSPGDYNIGPFTVLPDFTTSPLTETFLQTANLVDMNTATPTTLFTVGQFSSGVVITKVVVRNASTSLTTASFSFGWNSASYNDVVANATHTELTGSTLMTILAPKTGAKIGVAADNLKIQLNTLQGSAATVSVDVYGYYVQ